MTKSQKSWIAAVVSVAIVTPSLVLSTAEAQVAPIRYWMPSGLFGVGTGGETEGPAFGFATDDEGSSRGFAFRSYSVPVSAFASSPLTGNLGAFGSASNLAADGAQYAYRFKGVGDMPVTLFGGVGTLRATPDAFTTLTSSAFDSGRTLATSVHAGVEFKPASNVSLSLSAGYVQSSGALNGEPPIYQGLKR